MRNLIITLIVVATTILSCATQTAMTIADEPLNDQSYQPTSGSQYELPADVFTQIWQQANMGKQLPKVNTQDYPFWGYFPSKNIFAPTDGHNGINISARVTVSYAKVNSFYHVLNTSNVGPSYGKQPVTGHGKWKVTENVSAHDAFTRRAKKNNKDAKKAIMSKGFGLHKSQVNNIGNLLTEDVDQPLPGHNWSLRDEWKHGNPLKGKLRITVTTASALIAKEKRYLGKMVKDELIAPELLYRKSEGLDETYNKIIGLGCPAQPSPEALKAIQESMRDGIINMDDWTIELKEGGAFAYEVMMGDTYLGWRFLAIRPFKILDVIQTQPVDVDDGSPRFDFMQGNKATPTEEEREEPANKKNGIAATMYVGWNFAQNHDFREGGRDYILGTDLGYIWNVDDARLGFLIGISYEPFNTDGNITKPLVGPMYGDSKIEESGVTYSWNAKIYASPSNWPISFTIGYGQDYISADQTITEQIHNMATGNTKTEPPRDAEVEYLYHLLLAGISIDLNAQGTVQLDLDARFATFDDEVKGNQPFFFQGATAGLRIVF